ncbi:MAG: hypothetical protein SOU51_01085 [Collinsella sp.]|nr:hypothetical protein [Collinsella sp.]
MSSINTLINALATLLTIGGGIKLGLAIYGILERRSNNQPGTGTEMWDVLTGAFLIALGAGGFLANLFAGFGAIS